MWGHDLKTESGLTPWTVIYAAGFMVLFFVGDLGSTGFIRPALTWMIGWVAVYVFWEKWRGGRVWRSCRKRVDDDNGNE